MDDKNIDVDNNVTNVEEPQIMDVVDDKAEDNSLENTSSEVDVITGEEHKTDSSEQPVEIKKTNKKGFKLPTFGLKYVKSVPRNVCIIGIIIFFVLGLLLGKMFFSKNYCAVSTKPVIENKKLVADGKNNITEVNNFKYKIPNSYVYDKSDGYLLVYDADNKFKIAIRSIKGSYDDLALSKVSIKESVKEQGYVVNDIKELVVSNNNYIVLDLMDNATKHLIAFTGLNDYVMYVDIVTSSNDIDETILNTAEDIIRNAEYISKIDTLESTKKIDVADISIKAAEEYKKATNK